MSNFFVFQTDSNIVNDTYSKSLNYLVEYNELCPYKDTCAIYFSSNEIYYPNTETTFRHRIVDNNVFEWYKIRFNLAYKHIFVRDIFKQWYLNGINANISTPELLFDFLSENTKNYNHVYTIGSSAGGYAAILYGIQLKADKILAFDAQFELNSLLDVSSEKTDPIIFRKANSPLRKFYDLANIVDLNNSGIFYFYSNKSIWDRKMCNHIIINKVSRLNVLAFSTKHHGIPFLKVALPTVINMDCKELIKLSHKVHNPIIFTIKCVGLFKTILGLYTQICKLIKIR